MMIRMSLESEHKPVHKLTLNRIPRTNFSHIFISVIVPVDKPIVFDILDGLHNIDTSVWKRADKESFANSTAFLDGQKNKQKIIPQCGPQITSKNFLRESVIEPITMNQSFEIVGKHALIFGWCDRILQSAHFLMMKIQMLSGIYCKLKEKQIQVCEKVAPWLRTVKELVGGVDWHWNC